MDTGRIRQRWNEREKSKNKESPKTEGFGFGYGFSMDGLNWVGFLTRFLMGGGFVCIVGEGGEEGISVFR